MRLWLSTRLFSSTRIGSALCLHVRRRSRLRLRLCLQHKLRPRRLPALCKLLPLRILVQCSPVAPQLPHLHLAARQYFRNLWRSLTANSRQAHPVQSHASGGESDRRRGTLVLTRKVIPSLRITADILKIGFINRQGEGCYSRCVGGSWWTSGGVGGGWGCNW